MCFIVVPLTPVRKLCGAAQNVQALIDDGTLSAAFGNPTEHHNTLAVTAFDALAESAAQVEAQLKGVSPYLRYRREILAEGPMAAGLRRLALNLYNDRQGIRLSTFFINADEHHTRIALEMIAGYTKQGENDPHFMALANDLNEAIGNQWFSDQPVTPTEAGAPQPDFYGTEHEKGLDGLYCCCDSRTDVPPEGFTRRWRKTNQPATSPEYGTPAWSAYCAKEELWEPVLVPINVKGSVL